LSLLKSRGAQDDFVALLMANELKFC